MSRRINCTLTDAQWDALVAAFAHYDYELESAYDDGNEGAARTVRKRGVLDRAWWRILGKGR